MEAICITFGEQSENHSGMQMIGNGLSQNGYSLSNLIIAKDMFEKLGCKCQIIHLNKTLIPGYHAEDAYVLYCSDFVDKALGQGYQKCVYSELADLNWDKKYYDTRRSKVLNKKARYNLCFDDQSQQPDYQNKKGTIISYDQTPYLRGLKNCIQKMSNPDEKLQCEGNYYYDLKKTYIKFHGDKERKKVIGINLAPNYDCTREIHWIWYYQSQRISGRTIIELNPGDLYIMSEKSSGFDWKKRSITTVRHAAAIGGSIYLE